MPEGGGILILWDKRQWAVRDIHRGSCTISCFTGGVLQSTQEISGGVLQASMDLTTIQKRILWHELAAVRVCG